MTVAGAFIGRIAELAVSNAVSADVTTATFVAVEKANSPRMPITLDTAESSSNDSLGSKEFLPTWDSATLSFELIADEAAVGQEHLWTALLNKEVRAFRYRPRGDVAGDRQMRVLGIVTSIEPSSDKGDVTKYAVSVQKTGAVLRDIQ
jgi:hypothetical protein